MMAWSRQVVRPAPLIQGSYIKGYSPIMLSPSMVPIASLNPYPVWFSNVPRAHLVEHKGGQNWISIEKDKFKFPGGGTQFIHGADQYLDQNSQMVLDMHLVKIPEWLWILDVVWRVLVPICCQGMSSLYR